MTQAAAQSHPFSAVQAVFFSFAIFGPLLVINAFQFLSILWKHISMKWFRRYNNFWAHLYWTYVGWAARSIGGMKVEMLGDRIPRNENALVLANHQSAVDTIVQLIVGKTVERLGDMKFFVKDILKWVPGPGWGMVFLECIFMKRNWTEDRQRVVKQLQKFRQDRVPVWVNIYPEGTRLRASNLATTQEFARKNGLFIPQNLLIPRVRGFQATLEGLEGHLHAVYDLTIVYKDKPPGLWDLLSRRGSPVKVEVRRYPIEQLPADAEGRGHWLIQLFQAKDQRIESLKASF